ncbi:MAG: Ig-like domain-containing domain [Bacteroidetes bacterium]|nr:Ig-like domain-containing domain [Bacteroidota bacterium]
MNYQFNLQTIFPSAIIILIALIQFGCANESVPTGGKKDEKPPEAKKISPTNKSLHFNSTQIKITFNEFLKETGFTQTLISPPQDKRPEFHVEGRTLTIKLKSPLRDSTTYTINFADDVKDLNEGNTTSNFSYVFSTGDFIDSQKISGSVMLAKDNTNQEGIVVSLYPKDSGDGILKSKPFYFAKTDKAGQFKIENIKAGKYLAYALKDQNYNYIYDQPNELIAFSDSILDLTDSVKAEVRLFLFDENKKKAQLDMVKALSPGQLQISYNRPISNFKLDWRGLSKEDFAYIYPTNDTIIYWYSKYYIQKDSFYLSANDTILDTARLELKFVKQDSLFTGNNILSAGVNQSNRSKEDTAKRVDFTFQEFNKAVKINLTRPCININETKRLHLFEDSSANYSELKFTVDEKTKQSITADFQKKENAKYSIEIPDSTVQDIFGKWNRKLVYKFITNAKNSYGNLHITLKTQHPENYYVIKLLDASNTTVEEFFFTGNGERKVSAENILAGSYKFVVIEDTNKNGVWDTGIFKDKKQPEKIFTYKESYQLKGGWDLDAEVKF